MKEYKIHFEELFEVYIEAQSKEEAREKFMNGEYDNVHNLAINMIDIEEGE